MNFFFTLDCFDVCLVYSFFGIPPLPSPSVQLDNYHRNDKRVSGGDQRKFLRAFFPPRRKAENDDTCSWWFFLLRNKSASPVSCLLKINIRFSSDCLRSLSHRLISGWPESNTVSFIFFAVQRHSLTAGVCKRWHKKKRKLSIAHRRCTFLGGSVKDFFQTER